MAKGLVAITMRNGVLFCTLHMGTQIPSSVAQENTKMNKHRSNISLPENNTFIGLGVSAIFPLENVWGMAMTHFNSFSGSHEGLDSYSIHHRDTDYETTGFERGFF